MSYPDGYSTLRGVPDFIVEGRLEEIHSEMTSLRSAIEEEEFADLKKLMHLIENGEVTEARKACTDLIESLKCRENELIELDNRLTFIDS